MKKVYIKKNIRNRWISALLSMALAFALVFSMSGTAFAGETDGIAYGANSFESSSGQPGDSDSGDGAEDDSERDPSLPAGESEAPLDGADEDGAVAEDGVDAEETANPDDPSSEEAFGFPGMPAGFALSNEDRALKASLIENGIIKSFSKTVAGEDYVEGEAVFYADSREYAEVVAGAYGAELSYYENKVAVMNLPEGLSAFGAVSAASNPGNSLPPVFPNFIYRLPEPIRTEKVSVSSGEIHALSGEAAPAKKNWSSYTFNDPYLQNPGAGPEEYQWFHDAIGTYAAWGTTTGANVTVAVLDTGIQSSHPEFPSGALVNIYNAVPGADTNGHGTYIAGIIAARANSAGGRGVAPNANFIAVRVLDNNGEGTTGSIASGINWVVNNTYAHIINMSFSGYFEDIAIGSAIADAIEDGIVVIAAAGDERSNNRCTPGTYPGVICVAATDKNNLRSHFSNYGPQVTLSAPGSDILSAFPTTGTTTPSSIGVIGYEVMSSTAAAAAIVSGAAALYMSATSRPHDAKGVAAVKDALVKAATAAGSPQIGKVVNVGNIFNAAIVPTFTLREGGGVGSISASNWKKPIPDSYDLIINANGSNMIVYTDDGSNPTVKNGIVTNGKVYTTRFSLSTLPLGKVTIKALTVNGQGTVSKVATLSITTVASNPNVFENYITIIEGPKYLAAGKSGKYTAQITAAAASNAGNKIEWYVRATDLNKAAINSKTGMLTIKQGVSGTIRIIASTNGSIMNSQSTYMDVTITSPIASMSMSVPAGFETLVSGDPTVGSCTLGLAATLASGGGASDLNNRVIWSTSNKKIALVDGSGKVTAVGGGKATITAKATDGSGKSAKVTVNCVQPAQSVKISGSIKQIAAGGTLTLKAATIPAKPTVGGVNWSVEDLTGLARGISIDTKGKLKVPAGVSAGSIKITASAKDGYGASDSVTIALTDKKAKEVLIHRDTAADISSRVKLNKNTGIAAVQLFTVNPTVPTKFDDENAILALQIDETEIQLSGTVVYSDGSSVGGAAYTSWSSNKPAVATVDEDTGLVKAVGAGTATITCLVSDGSGKKAKCKVNVGVPASSMGVQGRNALTTHENPTLAFGKSLQMSAMPGSAYGKVSNTKVWWSYKTYTVDTSIVPWVYTEDLSLRQKVSISASGKLTIKSNLLSDRDLTGKELAVEVIATAQDGSNVSASRFVDLVPGTSAMQFDPAVRYDGGDQTKASLAFRSGFYSGKLYGNFYGDYVITSSNPKVAAIGNYGKVDSEYYSVDLIAIAGGNATIKVVSNDGTGKSASFSVKSVWDGGVGAYVIRR